MKVEFKKNYVLIISSRLTYLLGIFSGTPKFAKAVAFFPFIFVRSEDVVEPWLINHERIHFRQQLETLFVGLMILDLVETLYVVIVLKKSLLEAYKWRSSEQEAYRNQNNRDYLRERKIWSIFRYIRDKKEFGFASPGKEDKPIQKKTFEIAKGFLGKKVSLVFDRPLGSKHPKHGFVYVVNYGYVPGVIANDGEELDAYYLGTQESLEKVDGFVVAII